VTNDQLFGFWPRGSRQKAIAENLLKGSFRHRIQGKAQGEEQEKREPPEFQLVSVAETLTSTG
jgi:hypothetical protein